MTADTGLDGVMKRQLAGYGVTGGIAAIVDVGMFWLLLPHAAMPVAAVLSFTVALAVNYRLTATWVFRRDWRDPAQALRFVLFAMVGMAVNVGVTAAVAAWLAASEPREAILAKVAGIGVAFVANFAMNARWVFAANPGARRTLRRPRTPAPR